MGRIPLFRRGDHRVVVTDFTAGMFAVVKGDVLTDKHAHLAPTHYAGWLSWPARILSGAPAVLVGERAASLVAPVRDQSRLVRVPGAALESTIGNSRDVACSRHHWSAVTLRRSSCWLREPLCWAEAGTDSSVCRGIRGDDECPPSGRDRGSTSRATPVWCPGSRAGHAPVSRGANDVEGARCRRCSTSQARRVRSRWAGSMRNAIWHTIASLCLRSAWAISSARWVGRRRCQRVAGSMVATTTDTRSAARWVRMYRASDRATELSVSSIRISSV
ncbi:hypothetical protein OPAG_06703 [Rhodococcus opacus PD630]|nr:hypothetical protein OPAG_06703 [Rhodococcus opacus PD630]